MRICFAFTAILAMILTSAGSAGDAVKIDLVTRTTLLEEAIVPTGSSGNSCAEGDVDLRQVRWEEIALIGDVLAMKVGAVPDDENSRSSIDAVLHALEVRLERATCQAATSSSVMGGFGFDEYVCRLPDVKALSGLYAELLASKSPEEHIRRGKVLLDAYEGLLRTGQDVDFIVTPRSPGRWDSIAFSSLGNGCQDSEAELVRTMVSALFPFAAWSATASRANITSWQFLRACNVALSLVSECLSNHAPERLAELESLRKEMESLPGFSEENGHIACSKEFPVIWGRMPAECRSGHGM